MVDIKAMTLCTRPITETNPNFAALSLDERLDLLTCGGAVANALLTNIKTKLAIRIGDVQTRSQHRLVTLRVDERYLTALPGRKATDTASAVNSWEQFLLLAEDDFSLLLRIKSGNWQIGSSGMIASGRQCGLSGFFMLNFGPIKLDLLDNLPLSVCTDGKTITFVGVDGLSETVEEIQSNGHGNAPATIGDGPKIWINPLGQSANKALQYLVAERIRSLVPGSVIENIVLPEWGKLSPSTALRSQNIARLEPPDFWFDLFGIANCLSRSVIDTFVIDSYPFDIQLLPSRSESRLLLNPMLGSAAVQGFGKSELVCHIRGGDILRNAHPDYVVLPPAYYRSLAERSGLDLVFLGQIADDPYSLSLREAFPDAQFITARSPELDFESLRRSQNIAIGVSTFSWLAAWLSEADKVFIPVAGMLNPIQVPYQNFLPLDDPTFEYTLFPVSKMVDIQTEPSEFIRIQSTLERYFRPVTVAELTTICLRRDGFLQRRTYVGGFDPEYYTECLPTVATEIASGNLGSALQHYMRTGNKNREYAIEFDSRDYVARYPDVAMSISEANAQDPLDHYLRFGYRKNYIPRVWA